MKSTGETTNTTEKEQKLPVTEKNGTAPEKTEHILNRLIIGAGVCVAVIAVLIGVKLYRQDRQMDITEPFARSMVLASDPLSAEKRFQAETLSADLCVGETSVPLNDISFSSQVKAGLFDLDHKKVLFAQNMYDQVYPASITKIMTALLAMEYNQPDTQVTITEEDLALEDGSQMSGLAVGDTVTMDQLFHALLIYSANDAAMAIARQVGIDQYFSEVLPEDKASFVEKEKELGHKVIMIGDGINDSLALSSASVGIAISDGAAIAREIADVTISADNLHEIVTLKRLSTALMKRIHNNYRTIIGVNGGLIALGVTGVIMPTTSALLHNLSTLTISLRSMRNLLPKEEEA